MNWIVLFARPLLAAVFLVAAVGKLADRQGSRQAVVDFGVPKGLAASVAFGLPLVELAIVVLLIPGATARWGAFAALGLLGLFIAGMTISLARGKKPNCHCFGQLHSSPVGWSTVLRNGSLAGIAAVVAWRGGSADIASIAPRGGTDAAAWTALTVAFIALALAAIEAWFLLNLLPQQGRLLLRLETLEAALGQGRFTSLAGQQAPEFELLNLSGATLSLATLRSSGQPVVLLFTNPDCGPCDAVLPDVARWQREHVNRINIAVISHGSVEVNLAKAKEHGLQMVLLQNEREVLEAYHVDSTPAAVLVTGEGRIASPTSYGAELIAGLLQQALNGGAPKTDQSGGRESDAS